MHTTRFQTAAGIATLLAAMTGCSPDAAAPSAACAGKRDLRASGSSAQAAAMTRFITSYENACPGHSLDYTSNGSGAGVAEFAAGLTDFGASDSPIAPASEDWAKARARCGGSTPWNLPLVFGPIAVTYNVFGVDTLTLDASTTAKIFTGRITSWDAPEIAALNPDQQLPRQPIVVFFRSDDSGTTDNFQQYLQAAAGAAWGRGAGKAFQGGVGRGRRGNEGTSAEIAPTPGSITYTEWSFAQRQQLPVARIITSAGSDPVPLSVDTVTASISDIRIKGSGNDLTLDLSGLYQPGRRGAYPIVLATYEVVCSRYPDPQTAEAIKTFLEAALTIGQDGLTEIGYVPVTPSIAGRLTAAIAAMT